MSFVVPRDLPCDFYNRVTSDFEWFTHQRAPSHSSVPSLDSRHSSISEEDFSSAHRRSADSESPDTALYEFSILDDQSDVVSDLLYPSLFPLPPIALNNELCLDLDYDPYNSAPSTSCSESKNPEDTSTSKEQIAATVPSSTYSNNNDQPQPSTYSELFETAQQSDNDWDNNEEEIEEDEDQDEDEHFYEDIFEPWPPVRLSPGLYCEYQQSSLDTSSYHDRENPYHPEYEKDEYDDYEVQGNTNSQPGINRNFNLFSLLVIFGKVSSWIYAAWWITGM